MAYHVVISPTAARHLQERLPEAVARACYEFIRGPLAEEPHRVGAPLRAPFEGHWRARRGEYRVRYAINEDGKEIHVLDVDHRRAVIASLDADVPVRGQAAVGQGERASPDRWDWAPAGGAHRHAHRLAQRESPGGRSEKSEKLSERTRSGSEPSAVRRRGGRGPGGEDSPGRPGSAG